MMMLNVNDQINDQVFIFCSLMNLHFKSLLFFYYFYIFFVLEMHS